MIVIFSERLAVDNMSCQLKKYQQNVVRCYCFRACLKVKCFFFIGNVYTFMHTAVVYIIYLHNVSYRPNYWTTKHVTQ